MWKRENMFSLLETLKDIENNISCVPLELRKPHPSDRNKRVH